MGDCEDINNYGTYQICVQGVLDPKWSCWFEGLNIEEAGDYTLIRGQFIDQAALRGVINKLWDLNLNLISVNLINKSEENKNG